MIESFTFVNLIVLYTLFVGSALGYRVAQIYYQTMMSVTFANTLAVYMLLIGSAIGCRIGQMYYRLMRVPTDIPLLQPTALSWKQYLFVLPYFTVIVSIAQTTLAFQFIARQVVRFDKHQVLVGPINNWLMDQRYKFQFWCEDVTRQFAKREPIRWPPMLTRLYRNRFMTAILKGVGIYCAICTMILAPVVIVLGAKEYMRSYVSIVKYVREQVRKVQLPRIATDDDVDQIIDQYRRLVTNVIQSQFQYLQLLVDHTVPFLLPLILATIESHRYDAPDAYAMAKSALAVVYEQGDAKTLEKTYCRMQRAIAPTIHSHVFPDVGQPELSLTIAEYLY